MGAAFRYGRPLVAPMRKEHEHILGEELDWALAETTRNELDDQEVEMRLMAECDDSCRNEEVEREELMIISGVESDSESGIVAAGPRSGREPEEEWATGSDSAAAGLRSGCTSEWGERQGRRCE